MRKFAGCTSEIDGVAQSIRRSGNINQASKIESRCIKVWFRSGAREDSAGASNRVDSLSVGTAVYGKEENEAGSDK